MIIILFTLSGNANALPTAEMTLEVVDENGEPVKNATVVVRFTEPRTNADGWGTNGFNKRDVTGSDGRVTLSASSLAEISYTVSKDGYYNSYDEYLFKSIGGIYGFRKYEPVNPVLTITLKKKVDPRGLYVRSLKNKYSIKIPEMNKPIGFDLIESDWVVPYGLGTNRDFVFELKGQIISRAQFDLQLILTFDNEDDGAQKRFMNPNFGSELILPHHAPTDGYENVYRQEYSFMPTKIRSEFYNSNNYFFRVRTKKDEDGNIISALYGKIHGSIAFDFEQNISFTYYLNPDSLDTNLEFDPQRNLFTDPEIKSSAPKRP